FAALADFPAANRTSTDLNRIVENTLTLFAGRLEGIEVRLHLAENLPPVLADAEALKRAFSNLIDNAAEAMQSMLLRVLTLRTGTNETQTMAEIVIADTGHGITDEIRERLFLPFFSTRRRGTGLGLSIAAKIVQEHQGNIHVESNSPTGARFVILIPFADSPSLSEIAAPSISVVER
ncbi:MAG: ATP-binding protein, partial [Acidobacteriaceae bacterium]